MKNRILVLVDGENLVFRYEEMLKLGREPHADNIHIQNIFVWNNRLFGLPVGEDVLRIQIYTSVVGDHDRVNEVRSSIQQQMYACGGSSGRTWQRLRALVLKKSRSSKKAKTVDVQICLDALSHATNRNMETLYLASGDGDFVPLVQEIMRHGVRVHVFALSNGISNELRLAGDDFQSLDDVLFKEDAS